MKLTTNYSLKKPEGSDVVNIDDFNYNSDVIDNEFNVINTKLDEALQLGVNAKDNVVQAINSKKTVPKVTNDNNWESLSQSIRNIKEGSGNAVASDVLAGKTFTNNDGVEYTGTMVNRGGATTVTPTTSNQTKSAGYYSGAITIKGDSNLVASNILSGKSIFGVKGNVKAETYAMGTSQMVVDNWDSAAMCYIHVSGLKFKPRIVVAIRSETATEYNANIAESSIAIASGHSLLTDAGRVTNKDYVFWSNKSVGKLNYYNAGEMTLYKFFQMGTNFFRIPVSFTSNPPSSYKNAVFHWVAYP